MSNEQTMKRTRRLRELIGSPRLEFLMEAHNGLSAVIAQEAGFEGLWASGFSMTASLGLPDNNEASFAEVLQIVEYMADKTHVPILMDGDTGYGDYNNLRRMVRKLEQRGVAGVCIEDKVFPKRNSFIRGTRQPLAAIDEFCGKIKAGKDVQRDPDFVIVARVEAFIAGWGLEEALLRAHAYADAGADAILIHSAKHSADDVLAFKAAWDNRLPVVVVPTKYYATPTHVLADAGFSLCIWANHMVRAAALAMQRVARQIKADGNLHAVEASVAPIAEIFRIQGEPALAEAEPRYLPALQSPRVILLAAERGQELGRLTRDTPKAMVQVGVRPLLAHVLSVYRAVGLSDVIVVRGYRKERVTLDGPCYVDNDEHDTSSEAWSLWQARASLQGPCVISYGDVLFRKNVPVLALDCKEDLVICADTQWRPQPAAALVVCSESHGRGTYHHRVLLKEMLTSTESRTVHGEWMGILRTSARGSALLCALLERWHEQGTLRHASMPEVLTALVAEGHEVRVLYTTGNWMDVETPDDVIAASQFV
jgi:phosphoenolpyruvate phosphomutase